MDYILLNLLSGEVVDYQTNLINQIYDKFGLAKVKRMGAPPHFTLKYWFRTDRIKPVAEDLDKFCSRQKPAPVKLGGFEAFGENVIYMKVELSDEAMHTFKNLMTLLRQYEWMEWAEFDFPNLIFHATVAIECGDKFKAVWDYLKDRERTYKARFDNVSIIMLTGGTRATGPIDIYKSIQMK